MDKVIDGQRYGVRSTRAFDEGEIVYMDEVKDLEFIVVSQTTKRMFTSIVGIQRRATESGDKYESLSTPQQVMANRLDSTGGNYFTEGGTNEE